MERSETLVSLAAALDRLNRRLGRQWGPLSRAQWAVIRSLAKGPVPVGALANRLEVSTAGITRMLDKLEEAGFITRFRHTEDLRLVSAAVTETGLQALDLARQAYVARLQILTEALTVKQLGDLLEVLEQLAPSKWT